MDCQLFILPSKDIELTILCLFSSLPWTGEKVTFEDLFVRSCLFTPPHPQPSQHPTLNSSGAPQEALCLSHGRPHEPNQTGSRIGEL